MSTDLSYSPTATPFGILSLQPIFSPTIIPASAVTLSQLPPLECLLLANRLAELYAMVFPDQPDWLQEEINWVDADDMAASVAQFIGRVNTLFPVYPEFWEVDIEDVEWPLYEIPITPYGFDLWDTDWDDFKEPIPYLLHMYYSRRAEMNLDREDSFQQLYPELQVPLSLEPHQLVGTLRQMPLPDQLEGLPDLMLMLEKNTGNIWLDMSVYELSDGSLSYDWTHDNVNELSNTWQQAKPIIERVFRLLDWQHSISRTTGGKLAAVREVLLQAYTQVQSNPEKT